MNTLPDLPFELMLSYLDLKNLIKSRAVSRGWLNRIDCFRAESLCFSEWEKDYILDKYRRISGNRFFSRNYISSPSFGSFFDNFAGSILRNLKHLRIFALSAEHASPNFIEKLESLERLENLDIIAVRCLCGDLRLALPSLQSIHLEELPGRATLTLYAPKLSKIKVWHADFKLIVIHPESVEKVVTKNDQILDVTRFKNLKTFYCERLLGIDAAFLSKLQRLNEIHFVGPQATLRALHDQKQRFNRANLKIFYHGLCLDSADDYAGLPNYLTLSEPLVDRMIVNSSRLSDELFYEWIYYYSNIERAVPRAPAGFWKKFTALKSIDVREVESIELFLDFLKCFDNIVALSFRHQQPQALFDQLPGHCPSLQVLQMESDASLDFLFELKELVSLTITNRIDGAFIRKVFGRLKWMQSFSFYCKDRLFSVSLNEQKQFGVFDCIRNQVFTDLDDLVGYVSLNRH